MERAYFTRDRRVLLEEVEGVLAIQISRDSGGQRMAQPSDFGRSATSMGAGGDVPLRLNAEEAAAFDRAGWTFVVPSSQIAEAYERRSNPEGVDSVGTVFRREDGRTVISTGYLAVKLAPDLSEAEAERALRAAELKVVRRLRFAPNLFEVEAVGRRDAIDTSVLLHDNEAFEFAEPILIEHIGNRYVPTDPAFVQQWQWSNEGGGVGAVAAWDRTRGRGVRLAVIDNGFDVTHEDLAIGLASRLCGYFDNTGGFRRTLTGFPDSDHGTFCAGMAGARENNNVGGCGAAPECELILVAALSDQVGSQLTLARSVAYCADPTTEDQTLRATDGADVISSSLGPSGSSAWSLSSVLDEAIRFAVAHGRGGLGSPIFWATSNGNDLVSDDQVVSHPDVIAVGRSNRENLPDNSAFGPELGLLAPGRNVYSTRSGGRYGVMVGTSFAAPCAAGIATLVLSVRPTLRWDQVRAILRTTAEKIGGGYDALGHSDTGGYGRVNAHRAVEVAVADGLGLDPKAPVIHGPAVVVRRDVPVFEVDPRPRRYYAVEVAADAGLFNPEATDLRRTADNFYATWEEVQSFVDLPTYRLPAAVWDRLKTNNQLYYRVWSNTGATTWLDHIASTPSSQYTQAPVLRIVPSIDAPARVSRQDAPLFEVDPRPHRYYAVEVAIDARLFNPEATGLRRTADNFYATWEEVQPFVELPTYRLPAAVWDRLKANSQLFYRVWSNASATSWLDHIASTPSSQYLRAPRVMIVA